jgi:hypothetical protein
MKQMQFLGGLNLAIQLVDKVLPFQARYPPGRLRFGMVPAKTVVGHLIQ